MDENLVLAVLAMFFITVIAVALLARQQVAMTLIEALVKAISSLFGNGFFAFNKEAKKTDKSDTASADMK